MSDDEFLMVDPVVAHSMLGTVASVKGAIETLLAHDLDRSTRDGLLLLANRRLDHLAEQLRHLALGFGSADAPTPN